MYSLIMSEEFTVFREKAKNRQEHVFLVGRNAEMTILKIDILK